jgi:16S rRNA (guanine527-N7)-methyltransferase
MQIIEKYFAQLTPLQTEQFERLDALYRFWNERINVVSRKDIDNLYLHHVLHSLAIAKIIRFTPNTRIIDAGTGGGFPGIPLAILFPEADFLLVDSIAKKTRVVAEVIKETGLMNCRVKNLRMDVLEDRADFVVCRAVTALPELFGWVRKNIRPGGVNSLKNGLLAFKGGELSGELDVLEREAKIHNLSDYFDEPFFQTKKIVYLPR